MPTYTPLGQSTNAENLAARLRSFYPMAEAEIAGLTSAQMDFSTARWRWGDWSIRRQVAHMASLCASWMVDRWGDRLFSKIIPAWYVPIAALPAAERWQAVSAGDSAALLARLKRGLDLAIDVAARESPTAMRAVHVDAEIGNGWKLMGLAHATGVARDQANPVVWHITLEGTLRHIYYEQIAHLYNVQRLKRAQGLPTSAQIPFEGYWALDGWDRSEP